MPAREANEVIGVSRRSDVSEPFDSSTTGATILPGVPLPQWGPPPEPEPEPAPAPEPVLVAAVSAPEPPALAVSAPVPTAPLMSAPMMAPPEPDDLVIAAPELGAEPAPVEFVAAPPAPETLAAHEYVAAPEHVAAPPEDLSALLAPPETDSIDPPEALPPFEPLAAVAAVAPAFTLEAPYSHTAPTATPVDAPEDLPALLDSPPAEQAEPMADGSHEPEPDVEPSARPPRPVVLVAIVGGVAVLAALAAFVWPGLLVTQDATTDTVAATLQVPATRTALGTPAAIAGMTRVTGAPDAALRATATRTTPTGFGTPVSAVYGTKGTPAATVIAWTAPSSAPAQTVSAAFTGFQSAASAAVTGITTVPAGSLGGQLSCGSGVVSSTPATVCFWADGSSFGAITVLRPASADRGAAVAAAVRAAVETRS